VDVAMAKTSLLLMGNNTAVIFLIAYRFTDKAIPMTMALMMMMTAIMIIMTSTKIIG
jgi:hypothetical protein